MSQLTPNLEAVLKEIQPILKQTGFAAVKPEEDDVSAGASVYYSGDKGALRIDYADGKISLFGTAVAYDAAQDGDYKRLSMSLLDDESSISDVKYVAADFTETIESKFDAKSKAITKSGSKNVQTVSKAAVKSGVSYDPITLANRLTLIFPELRPAYKENIDTYGDFLSEEFFSNYGTPVVIEAIKKNNPLVMKKLFNLLHEIYDDGTNDVQSLIAVTILGQLGNDKVLLANCVDYMSTSMAPPVIEVNRYLSTHSGKRSQAKLDNPPPYKPKKKKKSGGLMQALMGGGTPGMGM